MAAQIHAYSQGFVLSSKGGISAIQWAAHRLHHLVTEALIAAGFTGVSNVTGGFGGTRTPMGETVERGWMELGFPVERGSEDDKSYPALVAGVGK